MQKNGIHRRVDNPPVVTIFGAGVTGLTAAHELIERGFIVHVVEPKENPLEEHACQVGGMAANQLARVPVLNPMIVEWISRAIAASDPKSAAATGASPQARASVASILAALVRLEMEPVQTRAPITQRLRFAKGATADWREFADEYGITNKEKLQKVLIEIDQSLQEYKDDLRRMIRLVLRKQESRQIYEREIEDIVEGLEPFLLYVRVIGHTDADGTLESNIEISEEWAQAAISALIELNANKIPRLSRLLFPIGKGSETPLGKQSAFVDRQRSNRVEFSIIGQRIPGEHGYRFFPSFYRHLFDTMKRTPVFNQRGDLTAETAYDQLVATPDSAVGFRRSREVIPVKLRRFTTIKDLQNTIEFFKEKASFAPRDLLRLQIHFLKYLTSSKERRSKEAEDISFWEYIHADKVSYSLSAARFVDRAPQALVAMSAKETDARTQYNTVIQMLVQNPLDEFIPDMTLNATTNQAWLNRWKDYLKRKGVRFYTGSLRGLTLRQGEDGRDELIPVVRGPDIHAHRPLPEIDVRISEELEDDEFKPENSDFFVMALPFEKASKMVWETYFDPAVKEQRTKFCGPFRQLIEFDKVTGRRSPDGMEIPRSRDPCTGLPINKKDPLRDISGIQYFMPNNYRFVEGHVYYPESPWALTSISQFGYFRDRVELTGKYIGQQSFDIGDWYEIDPADNGTTAWNSTRQELAERTWAQALATLESEYARSLVKPKYYHLDGGIKYFIGPELNENQDFVRTIAAFRGNAVVQITGVAKDKLYRLKVCGHDNNQLPPIELKAEASDKEEDICQKLVSKLNDQKAIAAAIFDEPNRIIISPITTSSNGNVHIKTNGRSAKPVKIFIDGEEFALQNAGDKPLQNVGDNYVVRRGEDGTITVHSKQLPDTHGHGAFSVAVCSADNCVELLGGPRLTIELHAPLGSGHSLAEIPREVLDYAVVLHNENPYIINVPGQWRYRPGLNRATGKVDYTVEKDLFEECLFRRWVPAGTFMATYTRLTTMEAANESGRHAVNAIVQALMALPVDEGKELLFNGQGKLFGDPCRIWDPEDNELADLDSLKELDEALMREGLPHILDVFRVAEFLENLPENVSLEEAAERTRELLVSPARTASLVGLQLLETGIRAYFESMDALLPGKVFR